ncbi:DUF4349 domain-containing protein [Desulfofalx alkaliphila]|uniref:DUF4349 domain-containing protein n=1 Tax=Desulfofalx alkaliphila TaxID=105483 RepID=UPI0004E27F21|nr:DUF4349 domain-containing protein [Desulfofalx alkaliphila]
MRCQDVCKNLSAYLDGEISKNDAKKIAEHLLVCHHCRAQWEELQTTSALLRDMPEVVPPPEFMTGLRERLASMPAPEADNDDREGFFEKLRSVARAPWYKVVAAAAVFSLAIGITTLWNGGNVNIIDHDGVQKTKHQVNNSRLQVPAYIPVKPGDTSVALGDSKVGDQMTSDEPGAGGNAQPQGSENGNVNTTEPSAPATSTGRPESVNGGPAPANVGVSSIDVNVTNLVSTSSVMKIAVNDVDKANQKLASIARKYGGHVTGTGINVPVGNYSPVLAELSSLGEIVANIPSDKDLTAEYQSAVSDLKRKQQVENELINAINNSSGDPVLEQQLSELQGEIKALDNRIQSLAKSANYIKINITFTASN